VKPMGILSVLGNPLVLVPLIIIVIGAGAFLYKRRKK